MSRAHRAGDRRRRPARSSTTIRSARLPASSDPSASSHLSIRAGLIVAMATISRGEGRAATAWETMRAPPSARRAGSCCPTATSPTRASISTPSRARPRDVGRLAVEQQVAEWRPDHAAAVVRRGSRSRRRAGRRSGCRPASRDGPCRGWRCAERGSGGGRSSSTPSLRCRSRSESCRSAGRGTLGRVGLGHVGDARAGCRQVGVVRSPRRCGRRRGRSGGCRRSS